MSGLGATINLKREDANVNILSSPRIRARNYEKAKIHIGDRVPVFTNAVTPLATGAPVVTGSVTYLDVGLKFEVEPTIYWDDEVSMKLNLDVSSIVKEVTSGTSLSYQIGTRSASTVLRLRDGETQILAGLISDADRETASKVPGLSSFPILGRLFSSEKIDKSKQEIALSITPHVIRHGRRPNSASSEILYGTESSRGIPLTVKMSENERKSPRETKGAAGLPANVTMGTAVVGNLSEGPSQNEPASATASVGGKKANGLKAVTVPAAAGNPPESPARNGPTLAPDQEETKKSAAEDASEVPAKNELVPAEDAESAGQVP